MNIFRPPVTSEQPKKNNATWERFENYAKEDRPLQPIRKIIVKGSVDVVFRRHNKPMLVVAGETANAIASVKTYYKGDKLVIEREGDITINIGNMTIQGFSGSFVMNETVNGKPMNTSINQGRVMVGVALPEAPAVKIKGSGDVTLIDLDQESLDLEVEGSGDIAAYGNVAHLNIKVAGSGDVDASELTADRGNLSVTGSGDIEAFIRTEVRARVTGSGDIQVRGNPQHRDHNVVGSGKIKFR